MGCSSIPDQIYYEHAKFSYVTDQELYGVKDFWPTTEEFSTLGKGDCEGFAAYYAEKLNVPVIIGVVRNASGQFEGHAWVVFGVYIIDSGGVRYRGDEAYRAMYAIDNWDEVALLQQQSIREGDSDIFVKGIQPFISLTTDG